MMRIVRILLLLIGILVFANPAVYAQKKLREEVKADAALKLGKYADALKYYKAAYAKEKDNGRKVDIIFNIALCYKGLSKVKSAELWFRKAIVVKYPDPVVYYYYANALKENAKFDEAIKNFKKYKQLVPADSRSDIGIKSCKLSAKWLAKPTRYKVENMALFNSKSSDFSPAYASKKHNIVIFSSNRAGSKGNRVHEITGQGFTDLWQTTVDRKGKWSTPIPVAGETVNTEDEEGTPSLNIKGSSMFFTRCEVVKNKIEGCKIFYAGKKGQAWGGATKLNIEGVPDSVDVIHPTLSPNELMLVFAADLPGGYGGKDLWMITRAKKTSTEWSKPVNMGNAINTQGNELFPVFRKNKELYFSSDYHLGMGGLDIFKAVKGDDGKWKISNMKYPINSPQDDFGIVFDGNKERGFFSSNRPGGMGYDDIYRFYLPPLKLSVSGSVTDDKTESPIAGAKLIITGSDGSTQEIIVGPDGSFHLKLRPNVDYQIQISMKGYLNGRAGVSTKGIEEDKDIKVQVTMSPISKPIELPNIMYDYAKWTLRPESMASLDKLVQTLNDNPNIVIELSAHTDYRGNDQANMTLSQKRAESVVKYLISKGIAKERLVAKGYGESKPRTVDKKMAKRYNFLKEGDVLTEEYIKKLPTLDQQEVANQLNRRTEFKVLKTDYQSAPTGAPAPTGGASTPPKPKAEPTE